MGFIFDDGGSNITPRGIIDVGYVLTPDDDYQYVGGGGAINIPYFPSTTTPIYVPSTYPISQAPTQTTTRTPTNSDKSGETWLYVMIVAMMMIMVIVLAVVL